jgi:hypothetical protein
MKMTIRKIATIEDKIIYSIDTDGEITDDELLRGHSRINRILSDRYHYFEKGKDPNYPNRWILHMSTI